MKKFLILILVFIVLAPSAVIAQSDFLAKRDLYINAQKTFTSTRRSYLNNQTLQLRDLLAGHLREFLYARNDLLISYFSDLLDQAEDYLVQADFETVSFWQKYLTEQNQQIVSETSLVNMITLADGFSTKYPEMNTDTNKALVMLTIAQQSAIIKRIELFQLKVAQGLITNATDKDLIVIWLQEVGRKLSTARTSQDSAKELLSKMRPIRGDAKTSTELTKIKSELAVADGKIKEALSYLDEIVKRIEDNG